MNKNLIFEKIETWTFDKKIGSLYSISELKTVLFSEEFKQSLIYGGLFTSVSVLSAYMFGDSEAAIIAGSISVALNAIVNFFIGHKEDTGFWLKPFSIDKKEVDIYDSSFLNTKTSQETVNHLKVPLMDSPIKNLKSKKEEPSLHKKTLFLKTALSEYYYPNTKEKIVVGIIGYSDEAPMVLIYKIVPLKPEFLDVNIEDYLKDGHSFNSLIKKGVDLSVIEKLGDNLSRDIKLPKNVMLQVDSNIGNGMAAIYIPKEIRDWVYTVDYLNDTEKTEHILPMFLGKGLDCKPVFADLIDAPHVIIGGTTRSGKSNGILSILIAMAYSRSPDLLNYTLIDPKRVSLQLLNELPHVKTKAITDMEKGLSKLKILVSEMEARYELFEKEKVQDIQEYNTKYNNSLSYEVIVLEEFSAIVKNKTPIYDDDGKLTKLTVGSEMESALSYLTRAGRAAGYHCIFLTQKFSAELFDGELRENTDMGICFKVSSHQSSKMVIGHSGGEFLLSKGDALSNIPGINAPVRTQFGGFKNNSRDIKELALLIKEKWQKENSEPSIIENQRELITDQFI